MKTIIKNQPENIVDLKQKLNESISWLNLKWQDFIELFASNDGRIVLLNESAQSFFGSLQFVLLNDIILHICKLTEKKEFRTENSIKSNFCINQVIEHKNIIKDQIFVNQINDELKKIRNKTKKFIIWRNRSIAHDELVTKLGASQLPELRKNDFQSLINDIKALMNLVNVKINDTPWKFDEISGSIGRASYLIERLENAKKYKEMRLKLLDKQICELPEKYIEKILQNDKQLIK